MIEEHLNSLREAGKYHSEGFFTLDLASRDRKTLDFYKAQASFWQLKFVQLAVAGGSSSITMTCDRKTLKLRAADLQHPGLPFEKTSAMEVLVGGCLSRGEEFTLTQYGPVPWRLRISRAGKLEADHAPAVGRESRLVVEGPGHGQDLPSFWQRLFSRSRETADWVVFMRTRCRHMPIAMKIDGLSVREPHPFGFRPLAVVEVGANLGLFYGDWTGSGRKATAAEFSVAEARFQALVGIPDLPGGPSTIYLLRDGVLLHAYRADLGWRGAEILLDCPTFTTDATTVQIVEDDNFLSVVEKLRYIIKESAAQAFHKASSNNALDVGTMRAIRQELN